MRELPSPEELANLVSSVMDTMFGLSFHFADRSGSPLPFGTDTGWRSSAVPMEDTPPLLVAISSDDAGGRGLASAMFGCGPDEADLDMINDALGELANIVAGQLKSSMGLSSKLGTPQRFVDRIPPEQQFEWRAAFVHSAAGDINVWTAIRPGRS